jgi:hypothetical protein
LLLSRRSHTNGRSSTSFSTSDTPPALEDILHGLAVDFRAKGQGHHANPEQLHFAMAYQQHRGATPQQENVT